MSRVATAGLLDDGVDHLGQLIIRLRRIDRAVDLLDLSVGRQLDGTTFGGFRQLDGTT